jgi:RNase adaptor protein for sRNA GlmZ degradation
MATVINQQRKHCHMVAQHLFMSNFNKHMHVRYSSFERDYPTLANKVVIPTIEQVITEREHLLETIRTAEQLLSGIQSGHSQNTLKAMVELQEALKQYK